MCFLKNIITNNNIIVGNYTYYDDFENVYNFEKNVKYLYDFSTDKLIIGKFCAIANGVEFIMNGANHYTNGISSFPFSIFGNGWENAMEDKSYPDRGNITIGSDVWLGYKCAILPGVTIGHGSIVGAYSIVDKDIPPYSIVADFCNVAFAIYEGPPHALSPIAKTIKTETFLIKYPILNFSIFYTINNW